MRVFKQKLNGILIRFGHAFYFLPIRITRLLKHLLRGLKSRVTPEYPPLPVNPIFKWWVELLFLLIDLFTVPEIYETVMDFLKWQTRPLTFAEIKVAKSVFGNTINYKRVRIDENAKIACKKYHLYYVSFCTVNSWGELPNDIFIHEMMHVWQFQMMGSVYIPRALWAQNTNAGYNYGGTSVLQKIIEQGKGLAAFNLEQQADIVSDYYRLQNGMMPRWTTPSNHKLIGLYKYFIGKIRMKNMN